MEDFWKALLLGLAASDKEHGCGLVFMALSMVGVLFLVGMLLYASI